ncbi:MAG TPA: efflux RND transporter periplasmic adaptor subunit [Phnomibacter sp.]|nr:efflux RND transporter periplasmic adaptor subunit [Phnomibacter sp.]
MKLRPIAFASFLLLTLFACKSEEKKETPGGGGGERRPGGPPPVFDAVLATSFQVDRKIEAPGTVLPAENTDLHPEASGRVVAINFKEGSMVSAGTLLVKLFDGDLQAQLRKLDVQLKVAEATEKRQKELLAINGTSQQDYDIASLNVSNIKADMELVKVNIAKTELRAPFTGRLGLRNISLGAYVTPQTIVTNIAQTNNLKVEFAVPEQYAFEMVPGKAVSIRTTATRRNYNATILAAQNTIAQQTRNLSVRALVSNSDAMLTPGSFVQVGIQVGGAKEAIMIPTQAVVPSTRFKNVIVSENGKAAFKVVTTGYRDSARVEITSGLSVGDTIITNGLLTIKEGMPVKTRFKK